MRGKTILWLSLTVMLIASVFVALPVMSEPDPTMYIDPDTVQTNPGEPFYFDVKVSDIPSPGAAVWEFKLTWDTDLTMFHPSEETWLSYIYEGGFLSSVGDYHMDVDPQFAFSYIRVGCYLTEPGAATGDGTLCTIVLHCTESGVSDLHLFDTLLSTQDVEHIPHDTGDGYFYTAKPYVDFTISPLEVLPGDEVTFNASACWDPDGGTIDAYAWDFGDGGSGSGMIATHTYTDYSKNGFPVTLTVTDDEMDTWSRTRELRIWRDMGVVDIWPTDYDWAVTYTDVYHGMLDPVMGIPYMEFIVTTTNFGSVTETYQLYLYMDLDTTVLGDEFVLMDHTLTLGPGSGSGFSHWGYLLLDDPALELGLYTLTAIVESTNDQDPVNDVTETTLYVHARGEVIPDGLHVESRRYKINPRQPGMKLEGKVRNMEDLAMNPDGIYGRLVFEVMTPEGMTKVLRTESSDLLMNGDQSKTLTAHWYPTLEDVGTYEGIVYCEFGWDGVYFPLVGTEVLTISFEIKE